MLPQFVHSLFHVVVLDAILPLIALFLEPLCVRQTGHCHLSAFAYFVPFTFTGSALTPKYMLSLGLNSHVCQRYFQAQDGAAPAQGAMLAKETFVFLQMLHVTRNAVVTVSTSQNTKPTLGYVIISLFLNPPVSPDMQPQTTMPCLHCFCHFIKLTLAQNPLGGVLYCL